MAIKKSELYSSLWASCDELRGGMDASQYKDYVLVMLFIKYISDKWSGQPYAPITIPEGSSFKDMTLLKGKSDIGDQINKKIIAPLKEANHLSDMPDFDDPVKLGEGKEKVDRLTNLIAIFENPELDFSKNRAEGDDILGDAYEYLMRHFATESGKSKGQFYTPAEVSRIMSMIIGIGNTDSSASTTVYDPTCGSGSLLLKIGSAANTKVTLYGQEKDSTTSALARMNMILHDYPTAEIKQGNTLFKPLFTVNGNMQQFDYVVANPPFSDKRWSNGLSLPEDGKFNRFEGFGVPPSKNGDFAYLLHIVRSLKRNGKGAVILPHGVLFRGNAEGEIRKNLIQKGHIKGLIGLPANLFYGTGIPACIIVLDKENAQNRKAIFMIDASKGFHKDGNKNRLREQDIRRITDVFNSQEVINGYSKIVSIASIEENEFNLNIPRYIDTQEKEDIQDIDAHLNGGIPNVDIEALEKYWKVYPSLKTDLFTKDREGYSVLKVPKEKINTTIYEHSEFKSFIDSMNTLFSGWETKTDTYLKAQGKDCHPKQIITDISDSLLKLYENKPLVDNYDIYQYLLSYWHDVMQDDTYIISYDGWKAETYRIYKENNKKQMVDKGWTCDLVPKELVINRYFEAEKLEIENLNSDLETTVSQYQELEEEHNAEEAALYDVTKKTDAVSNLEEFKDLVLSKYFSELHKKQENLNEQITESTNKLNELSNNWVFDGLKNNKEKLTKTAITNAYKAMDMNADNTKILKEWLDTNQSITDSKKELKDLTLTIEESLQAKIDEDKTQEYIIELTIIQQYIDLRDKESDLKKQIREKEQELDDKLYVKYPKLNEDEIKELVINDKWITSLRNAIRGEIDQISQRLTNRIKELADRYDTPLPKINELVADLESKVSSHLEKNGNCMGVKTKERFFKTEFGEIPEDWNLFPLHEIFSFYSTSNFSKAQMTKDGEVGCVHYGLIHAINNTQFDLSKGVKYYIKSEEAKYENLKNGDVIMVDASEDLEGINKSVEVFGINDKNFISGLHTYLLRDKDLQLAEGYRGLVLNSDFVKKQMLQLAVGMKVFGVSKTQLVNIKLPIPPTKEEQEAIAEVLSDTVTLIQALEKKIAKKKLIKKGVMQQLLVPKEDWGEEIFENLCKTFTKQTGFDYTTHIKPTLLSSFKKGTIPFIQNKDFEGFWFNYETDFYIPEKVADKFPMILLDERCLLISISGKIGNVGVFSNARKSFIGGAIAIAKFKNPKLINWVMIYLQSEEGQAMLFKNVKAGSHQNLILDDIRKMIVPMPDEDEQIKIAQILTDIDREIENLENKLSKYQLAKQGMMQQLLTGKTRLTN